MAFVGALSSGLFFRSKIGGPDYIALLNRVSGQQLECVRPLNSITLTYDKSDSSLAVEIGERKIRLVYAGSHDFTDYFEGPHGEQIQIDPEIKLSGFATDIGGLCWE